METQLELCSQVLRPPSISITGREQWHIPSLSSSTGLFLHRTNNVAAVGKWFDGTNVYAFYGKRAPII